MNVNETRPWQAGQPVRTATDFAQWQAWKKQRILASQRHRRAQYRRIDYYPSDEAMAVIKGYLNGRRTYAQIIDALVQGLVPE
jgi:hypothetical protein